MNYSPLNPYKMTTISFPKKATLIMMMATFIMLAQFRVSAASAPSGLSEAYTQYHALQLALAGDNAMAAQKAAIGLKADLKDIRGAGKALSAATGIAGTQVITTQRKWFSSLSTDMMALLKAHVPKGSMIYVHYCPMAKAYWLSNSKTIKNPYYGQKMSDCGSTTGMIM